VVWKIGQQTRPSRRPADGRYCRQMREIEVDRGGRVLRARDAGDPSGPVVMYFHGTPGSRLDLSFDERVVADSGVRLVSFWEIPPVSVVGRVSVG
jgi:hypothetical protein